MVILTEIKKNSNQEKNIKPKILKIVIFYSYKGFYRNHTDISILLKELRFKEIEDLIK